MLESVCKCLGVLESVYKCLRVLESVCKWIEKTINQEVQVLYLNKGPGEPEALLQVLGRSGGHNNQELQ